jgi:hypothetical protein
VTPPAASSNSAATVDLKSTDSGAAAGRLEDPTVAAGQSFPLATASGADVVPVAPSLKAPGGEAPEAKHAELGPPYFGRFDLAVEDKVRAFDLVSAMVGRFFPCLLLFSLGARQCSRWE